MSDNIQLLTLQSSQVSTRYQCQKKHTEENNQTGTDLAVKCGDIKVKIVEKLLKVSEQFGTVNQ